MTAPLDDLLVDALRARGLAAAGFPSPSSAASSLRLRGIDGPHLPNVSPSETTPGAESRSNSASSRC